MAAIPLTSRAGQATLCGMRMLLLAAAICCLAVTVPSHAAAPGWHVTATVAESCSCTISCPCNFGGNPNRSPCEGNRLIAITSGRYEDVALAGFHRGMLSFTKAPITMDITEKKVKFSGPESAVEMDVMAGFGGKPVK